MQYGDKTEMNSVDPRGSTLSLVKHMLDIEADFEMVSESFMEIVHHEQK